MNEMPLSYQIVAIDRHDRPHILGCYDNFELAIARLKSLDDYVDRPDVLPRTEGLQAIELQEVRSVDRILLNVRGSDADRRG